MTSASEHGAVISCSMHSFVMAATMGLMKQVGGRVMVALKEVVSLFCCYSAFLLGRIGLRSGRECRHGFKWLSGPCLPTLTRDIRAPHPDGLCYIVHQPWSFLSNASLLMPFTLTRVTMIRRLLLSDVKNGEPKAGVRWSYGYQFRKLSFCGFYQPNRPTEYKVRELEFEPIGQLRVSPPSWPAESHGQGIRSRGLTPAAG